VKTTVKIKNKFKMVEAWLQHPIVLNGTLVDLVPLERGHLDALYEAASDRVLWQLTPTDCSATSNFYPAYEIALAERAKGNQYPFVIRHRGTNRLIGSTRFLEIYPRDKKLEIGWTWIVKEFWGTAINMECKLLLLTYCFETLMVKRVQLKTKDTNFRSRKAIEKIGGVFEGILRKDRIQSDGLSRNAAYYSILDDEWDDAKIKIKKQLQKFEIGGNSDVNLIPGGQKSY
jgi:RimJ/RimL family protein N-acetyltransferase